MRAVQSAVERFLTGRMLDLTKRLQELGSDIVGFGELVRAKQPKMESIVWREAYPHLPCCCLVRHLGQRPFEGGEVRRLG